MFLLGLGSKKIEEKQDEAPKASGRVIRSCSKCGQFFEVVHDSGEAAEGLHEMFLEYLSLEKRNPDYFEDFILQFMDVSIEDDNNTLNSSAGVEESICVDCMNSLISQFSMALNKEIGIADKYFDIKDILTPGGQEECPEQGGSVASGSDRPTSEERPVAPSQGYLDLLEAYDEFQEAKKRAEPESEIESLEEDEENKFSVINTVEMDEIVELRQNQSLELGLKQEFLHCESRRKGTENHISYLRAYLERLKKIDFLNFSFNIQIDNGISSINGLRPALLDADFDNWNEVNAALGASALLLHTILDRHKLPLSINPNGSYSTIRDFSSLVWPLHGSVLCNSDYNECNNFDKGVSMFVLLIDSTFREIPGTDESLPYPVNQQENTIGGICPNLLFNERESWNRAMSMNLINLKWLLVRSCESIRNKSNT
ncbi:hypothetical protein OJ252_1151 [Cryptosporidium canis]|uniref:Atg6 BARA domain-containing protein n=1 Tax=Cryptosporidium canis TaxID=195482 RepID=A0ABQ8P8Z0_9CRYT|nr:hypothetical protein OJ252_1151 [Cryptosporidium canis]